MNESKEITRGQRRELLAAQARAIDEAASGAAALFHGAEVSTEKELLLAMAVVDLRKALTTEVMEPIMSLMNSPLGFLTDKDPAKPTKRQDGNWETPKPYDVETVRDCVISCKMLGFRVVGNEFNIIAGKFYPAKGGFRRKLTDKLSFPGLTDFRDTYEVPRIAGDKGAIVKCKATWKRNGVPDSLECEFAVKNNANMGTDALLGKAERKLCKRVHDILLGASTPDAEIDEETLKSANAAPVDDPVPGGGATASTTDAKPSTTETETPPSTSAKPVESKDSPQSQLQAVVMDAGYSFRDFYSWSVESKQFKDADSVSCFAEVPGDVATRFLRARTGLLTQLAARKASDK